MSESTPIVRDEFFESLLGDFLDESGQLLDRLNENLLLLDEWVRSLGDSEPRRCDADLLNEMFRSAHSLKGLSAMLGLSDINALTHKLENVFDAARRDQLDLGSEVVELMFQGIDRLGAMVETLRGGGEAVDCDGVARAIAAVLQNAGAERKQTTQADAELALQAEADPSPSPASPQTPKATAKDRKVNALGDDSPAHSLLDGAASWCGIEDEADMASKYLPVFIDEAGLSLDTIAETLLAVESGGNAEDLERLLITSHRIKGSASSVGLNRAAKLAHIMEDLLQELIDSGRSLSPTIVDAMLQGADTLRVYIDGLRQGRNEPADFPSAASRLIDARTSATISALPEPASVPASPTGQAAEETPECPSLAAVAERVAVQTDHPDATLAGKVRFQPNLPLAGLKGRLIYEKLAHLGEVCHFDPPLAALEDLDCLAEVTFGVVTAVSIPDIQRQLRVGGVQEVLLQSVVADREAGAHGNPTSPSDAKSVGPDDQTSQPRHVHEKTAVLEPTSGDVGDEHDFAAGARNRSADAAARPTETLRVDTERLDQLMNLAGQLVINKARFVRIGEGLRGSLALKQSQLALNNVSAAIGRMATDGDAGATEADLRREVEELRSQARRVQNEMEGIRRELGILGTVRAAVQDLYEAIHQLDRVSDGIQQNVMGTRMVPIGPLFARFRRVVRDITRGNGRLIRLEIDGEKTELDKRMIDELGDPLIHMVRNAADHGIESPEAREAAGKPREGTISLRAFHRGNSIVIQVTDDGKGLDADRILRKAIERGLVAPADAGRLTRQQILQFIWEPGLSTAEKVTEVSGRGMGMDIVKSKIEDLHGTVELESAAGQGTTLTIKLPLTLAILPSLMVDIDGDVFAMPLEAVAEIVRVDTTSLSTVQGRWTAQVRGRVVSLIRLRDVFQWGTAREESTAESPKETTLVIIGEQGCELGLEVDRVLGEQDVVIKSMAENYRNVQGIAGASILGDGRVSLILDLGALMQMASAA